MSRNERAAKEAAKREQKQKDAPPQFEVGQAAITLKDMEFEWGTIKARTEVELLEYYKNGVVSMWKVETLGCKSCSLVIQFPIPEAHLEDYEISNPSIGL